MAGDAEPAEPHQPGRAGASNQVFSGGRREERRQPEPPGSEAPRPGSRARCGPCVDTAASSLPTTVRDRRTPRSPAPWACCPLSVPGSFPPRGEERGSTAVPDSSPGHRTLVSPVKHARLTRSHPSSGARGTEPSAATTRFGEARRQASAAAPYHREERPLRPAHHCRLAQPHPPAGRPAPLGHTF